MADLADRVVAAELDLMARGYDEGIARNAVRQALGWSLGIADKVRPEIRDQVASDLFTEALASSKYAAWADEFVKS